MGLEKEVKEGYESAKVQFLGLWMSTGVKKAISVVIVIAVVAIGFGFVNGVLGG